MPFVILVVDDEELTRRLYKHVLTRAGYTIIEANNGNEALHQLAIIRPDLIILDVLMPGLDGFTTLEQIRANPVTADLPVIFISSRADVGAEYRGLAAGAQRYLVKPISMADLEREVRTLLSSRETDQVPATDQNSARMPLNLLMS